MTDWTETAELLLLIATSVIFPSAFINYVETLDSFPEMVADGTDFSFFMSLYNILVTMAFIGYGSPAGSTPSRLFIACFLVYSTIKIPGTVVGVIIKMGS